MKNLNLSQWVAWLWVLGWVGMNSPGTWAQKITGDETRWENGYLPRYDYTVTDIATRGLTAQQLFSEMRTDFMELKSSICSNRAHLWGYDMSRKHGIQVGRIFVFFTSDVWKNDRKGYMYHAGTYVIENGQPLVLEGSYPEEVDRPLTITEWMDTEMERKVDARRCIEITENDTDLTQYFYRRINLPSERAPGKQGAPCYYRRVPGYIPYPATVAELELGVDMDGKKIEYTMSDFHSDDLTIACRDAYAGNHPIKRLSAGAFCKKYLKR